MKEQSERSLLRKTADKVFLGVSLVTLPIGLYVAGSSLIAGEFVTAAVAGGFAFIDYTQIREHGKPPSEQSWWNPEKILDRFWRGSNRLKQNTSTSMVYAAA